jgi:hypothetical protein
MNSCEPKKKSKVVDSFYDSFSSGVGHDRGHASRSSWFGPRHVSHGAFDGSLSKTLGDLGLFASGSTRFSRVAPLRRSSKAVSKSSHLNQPLRHASPHDKLSAPFTRVIKSWVPKHMLTDPLGSKT